MERVDVKRIRSAWEDAASDLGIRVQTRDCWLEGEAGDRFELAAIVPDFGGQHGMAMLPKVDTTGSKLAVARGYG
jgi:hypothetical protein